MPQERSLEARLSAVERTIGSDSERGRNQLRQGVENRPGEPVGDRQGEGPPEIRARVDELEAKVTELEAGLQAIRGYVGNLDHVNQSVERRANAAIAAVERLESAPDSQPALANVDTEGVGPDRPDSTRSSEPSQGTTGASQTSDSREDSMLDRVTALL